MFVQFELFEFHISATRFLSMQSCRCRQHKIQADRYGGCTSILLNTTSSLLFRTLHPPQPCYVTGPWERYVEAVTWYRSGQGA